MKYPKTGYAKNSLTIRNGSRNGEPMKSTSEKKNSAAAKFGRMGGRAGVGKCKARTSDQARAAVLVRWARVAAKKAA